MSSPVVNLRTDWFLKKKLAILCAITIAAALIISSEVIVEAQYLTEYERYVHEYFDSGSIGNWTYMEKPVFPVVLKDSQIAVGQNWSVVCPLSSNRTYHVYCYGSWIDYGKEPKTDYDIYVYNSLGEMEGSHTESAGLPEHLGTTVDEAFFAPKYTGNYTFVIANDPKESKGSQAATFMIIEDVECNIWHEHYVEGKDNDSLPVLATSWGYEFVTESQYVEVYIEVPETVDMYEARLYLMSDLQSKNLTVLNDVPLAWEPGLFGNRSNVNSLVGGYNLESKEYRGVAYASCEFYGQDMFLNFTSPFIGKNLYHLVLIGENGSGTTEFLVKTEFNNTSFKPSITPGRVYPGDNVTITCVSGSTILKNATLQYSTDSWRTLNVRTMEISNSTCKAIIPAQAGGTVVSYTVNALDILENTLTANGSYPVRSASMLNFSSVPAEVRIGENASIEGYLVPRTEDAPITVYLSSINTSKEIVCYTFEDGSFRASFRPETAGTWVIYTRFSGSSYYYDSESTTMTIQVVEPVLAKYSYYIFGTMSAIIAIGLVVYVRKSRG